jgi:DNA repair exonuclease SbcCD ATPase subunit
MSFDAARDVIADGSVDLLHIDGFHSYEAVRHDFEGWAPKLSPRGVVLFHDVNVMERGFGVARFWAEVAGRFPSFAFLHGHGLGVLAVGPEVPPAIGRLCATTAPSAVAVLRERFASLGRVHALDYALRETSRQEQRLRREAAERDAVVESLRRSLDEVLRHRDSVMAAQALAEQRLPAQEATITSLRQGLREAQSSLEDAQDRAARLESAALDSERTIAALRAETAELGRLRAEIEALWGNLAAARADAGRLQAEIDRRDSEMDALRSGAELALTAPRARFGLRPGRH